MSSTYIYTELTDEYIRKKAVERSGSVKADLRHHLIGILKVWSGLYRNMHYDLLPTMYEWILRLQAIINKERTLAKGRHKT